MTVVPGVLLDHVHQDFPQEVALGSDQARRIEQGIPSLDTMGHRKDSRTGLRMSLRWVLVHMIEEYARHNGHADFLRESIDGVTGE